LRKRLRLEDLKPRHLALGAGGLFLLSVAVTLIVLAASVGRRPAKDAAPPTAPSTSEPEVGAVGRLGMQDFLLEAPEAPPQPGVHLFRERTPRWSEEQVRRFWVPVDEAVLRILRRENDRRTEELLREVP
jgi:hypothetical protein